MNLFNFEEIYLFKEILYNYEPINIKLEGSWEGGG